MEHAFKIRSSEFIEDESWTKNCVNDLKNGSSNSSVALHHKSKRDVCFFELDASLNLHKILRKKQNGKIFFSGESLRDIYMYAWMLYVKDLSSSGGSGGGAQAAFDPVITVYSKVSSVSGDIRSVKQKFHGIVSSDSPRSVVDLKEVRRQSDIATSLGCEIYDDVVDLLLGNNFFYLCQRNNFKLSLDQFAEVQPHILGNDVDQIVFLKCVDCIASTEMSNNIEVELVRLLKEPIFRLLMDHLAEQCESDVCFQERRDEDDDAATVLISWDLLQTLVQFTREAYEERKSIIEDMKKTKVVLAIYRYFHESDSKSFSSSVTYDNPLVFRLKTDRCDKE